MAKVTKVQDFRKLNLEQEPKKKVKKKGKKNSSSIKVTKSSKEDRIGKERKKVGQEGISRKPIQSTQLKNKKEQEKERPNKGKGKPKRKVGGFILFFLVLICLGVGVGCLFTPTFDMSIVVINGEINVTKEQVLEKANVPLGTNIFKLNTKEVKDKILELPYVKSVKIKRSLPGTVVIDLEEKERYAVVPFLDSYLILDNQGTILEVVSENTFSDLPLIIGIDVENYEVGQTLTNHEKVKFDHIVVLLKSLKHNQFKYNINEINYEDPESILFTMNEIGITVNFGTIDQDDNIKILYLMDVLEKVEGKEGRIDLRGDLSKIIFEEKL